MSMAPPQGSSAGAYGQQAPQPVVVSSYSYHAQPMKPTAVLAGKPTLIQWDRLRFLIMDAPRDSNLVQYIREARAHNVTDIVRVCEPSYSAKEVEAAGIRLHEMSYEDGASPPPDVIDRWLALVDEVFYKPQLSHTASGLAAAATAAARRSSSSTASNGSQPGGSSAAAAGNGGAATTDPTAAAATSSTNSPQQHHQGLGAPAAASSTIAVHCVAGLGRAPVLVALALIEHGFGDPSAVVEFIRSQRRGAINMRQLNYLESYQRRSGSSCGACAIM